MERRRKRACDVNERRLAGKRLCERAKVPSAASPLNGGVEYGEAREGPI